MVYRSFSYRVRNRASRCVTPIVLYKKVDAQCYKLATDVRRTTLTTPWWTCREIFKSTVWEKFQKKIYSYFWRYTM